MRRHLGTRGGRAARGMAVLAAAAMLTTACGDRETARPSAESPQREAGDAGGELAVQLAWLPNVQSAGEYVALERGFYEEAGLDVTLEPGGPNANPVQLVASGTADVGVTYAPQIMFAEDKGIPVKAFGAAMQKAPLAYFSLAEENITSVEDYKGKKVGVQVGGEIFLASMLENFGLTLDDVEVVSVGGDTTSAVNGQVDVIAAWEINLEQTAPLRAAGETNHQTLFDNGVQFQSNYYVAGKDYVDNNAEQLAPFLDATAKGWQYALDNPQEAVDILLEVNPALSEETQLEQLTDYLPEYVMGGSAKEHGWGWMDMEMWQKAIDEFAAQGEIGAGISAEDLATTEVLEMADARGDS